MYFFFYGTLLDADIRKAVFGARAQRLRLTAATLRGYRRVVAAHGSYPVLVPNPMARVDGLLAEGFDPASLYRMAHFEGDRYMPRQCRVRRADGRSVSAWIFMPWQSRDAGARRWSLRHWQVRHKQKLLFDTRRWMREFGVDRGWSNDLSWPFRRCLHRLAAELADAEDGTEACRLAHAA